MATEARGRRPEAELPLADPSVEALTEWLVRACERRSAAEQRAVGPAKRSSREAPREEAE